MIFNTFNALSKPIKDMTYGASFHDIQGKLWRRIPEVETNENIVWAEDVSGRKNCFAACAMGIPYTGEAE